jgi:hypothetical protein
MSTVMATAKQRHIVGKGKNAHWVKWNGTLWVYDGKAKQGAAAPATSPSPAAASPSPSPTSTPSLAAHPVGKHWDIYQDYQGGKSVEDLAHKYLLSPYTIRQILYRQGKDQTQRITQYQKDINVAQGVMAPISNQGVVTAKAATTPIAGKTQVEMYNALPPEDKKLSDMGGVVGADPQALQYVRDNFTEIFGKGGGAEGDIRAAPKYIQKMVPEKVNSAYGSASGWLDHTDDLWKVLEENAGSWSGDADEDKKLATLGKQLAQMDHEIWSQHLAFSKAMSAISLGTDRYYRMHLFINDADMLEGETKDKFIKLEAAEKEVEKKYPEWGKRDAKEWKEIRDAGKPFSSFKDEIARQIGDAAIAFTKEYDPAKHSLSDLIGMRKTALGVLRDKNIISDKLIADQIPTAQKLIDGMFEVSKSASYEASDPRYVAAIAWLNQHKDELTEAFLNKPFAEAVMKLRDLSYDALSKSSALIGLLMPKISAGKGVSSRNHLNAATLAPSTYNAAQIASILKATDSSDIAAALGPRIREASNIRPFSLYAAYTKAGVTNRLKPTLAALVDTYDPQMQDLGKYLVAQSGMIKLRNYLSKSNPDIKVPPMSRKAMDAVWKPGDRNEITPLSRKAYASVLMEARRSFYTKAFKSQGSEATKFTLRTATVSERNEVVGRLDKTWDKVEHGGMHYRIKGVFRIDDSPMEKKFQKASQGKGEFKKVYHGTDFAAACSINRDQFRLGKAKVGRMLGAGIYVAANSSKSCQYLSDSGFSRHGTHGILFEAEAAISREDAHVTKGQHLDPRVLGSRIMKNEEWAIRDPERLIPRYWIDVELI